MSNSVFGIPLLETSIFLVLVVITVYRKRLSSNYEYRRIGLNSHRKSFFSNLRSLFDVPFMIFGRLLSRLVGALLIHGGKACQIKFLDEFITIKTNKNKLLTNNKIKNIKLNKNIDNNNFLLLLSRDNLFHIIIFLNHKDICSLATVNMSLYKEVTSDFIWEQLWLYQFKDVWCHPKIVAIRQVRGIYWDPLLKFGSPQQGWYIFYQQFIICYIDWLLAGANTQNYCFISLFGNILDITSFLSKHPGSPESLMEVSGGEATSHFIDIGHSKYAYNLSKEFQIANKSKVYLYCNNKNKTFNEINFLNESKKVISFVKSINLLNNKRNSIVSSAKYLSKKLTSSIKPNFEEEFDLMREESTLLSIFNDDNDKDENEHEHEYNPIRMIPLFPGFHDCYNKQSESRNENIKHIGSERAIWDPLEQRWYVWWTCCGYGVPIDIEDSIVRH